MNPNELKCGEVLTFARDCYSPADFLFKRGQTLKLIEPTNQAPYGIKSAISNWICDGPNGVTVWSSIYYCLEFGILKRG